MTKPVGKFVNFSQDHELNDWLTRNGYRTTEANRSVLRNIATKIKAYYGKSPADNLTWVELDEYYAKRGISGLEKK
ncbi:hypothetical protein ACYB9R_09250 [Alcaligenes aquatilis]|uniref:hypothetical protein n=1 Tax=Alcaligenes aquatilis TaxID=323284 RepID=UPI002AA70108|nr:hypothetical protein [Alcaligenes faecalis]